MESVVCAAEKEQRLLFVSALIKIMAKLVMNSHKIFGPDLNAHLDADIVFVVDVPGAGMADHITIYGFSEQRPLPESLRQRRKTQRLIKILAVFHHAARIEIFG